MRFVRSKDKVVMAAGIVGAALVVWYMTGLITATHVTSSGTPIVTYLYTEGVDNFVRNPVWSPDSRQLLILNQKHPNPLEYRYDLVLLSIGERGITGRAVVVRDLTDLSPTVAWRPDGKVVAVFESTVKTQLIHMYSVPDFREIARRDLAPTGGRIDNTLLLHAPRAMGFSADGLSLWIAPYFPPTDRADPIAEHITLALQLDARNLHVIDQFEIEVPVAGQKTVAGFSTFESTAQGLRLTTLVRSFSYSGGIPPGKSVVDLARNFVYAVNLQDRSNIFPPFELPIDNAADTNRTPQTPLLSADAQVLLIDMSTGGARMLPGQDLSKDRGYDVFDMTRRRRVAVFGGSPRPQDDSDDLHRRGRGTMTPDGRYFAFPVSADKAGEDYPSGLLVVDLSTGQIAQRLQIHSSKEPDFISISPDSRRLLVFGPSLGRPIDTMHVFHISE